MEEFCLGFAQQARLGRESRSVYQASAARIGQAVRPAKQARPPWRSGRSSTQGDAAQRGLLRLRRVLSRSAALESILDLRDGPARALRDHPDLFAETDQQVESTSSLAAATTTRSVSGVQPRVWKNPGAVSAGRFPHQRCRLMVVAAIRGRARHPAKRSGCSH